MAELGHPNEHMLALTDRDGDQIFVQPALKPSLVLISILSNTNGAVALDEEQTRALIEHLQQQLTSRC